MKSKDEKLQEKYIKKASRLYMNMLFMYTRLNRDSNRLAQLTSPELAGMVREEAKKIVRMSVPQHIIEEVIEDFADFIIKEEGEEGKDEGEEMDYIR